MPRKKQAARTKKGSTTKRELLKPHVATFFAKRTAGGQFKEMDVA